MATTEGVQLESPELQMLRLNKESGYNYRERRQDDWDENYLLYRDKVRINRLTQRQSVNIPLMKQTIRTLLKDVDDMPLLEFQNLDNDKDAEIFQNEYWKWTLEINNMEIKDIVDKRQGFLFGRTYDQMQIADGKVLMTIEDPEDILVDRFIDPADIDTTRFLIHTHIFRPLSSLANNPDYDQEAVKKLMEFYATQEGILKAADNAEMLIRKNKKMQEMGVPDIDHPVLGETYVEISLHFLFQEKASWYNPEGGEDGQGATEEVEDQFMVYVEVDDMEILMKKPLEAIIGKTEDNYWRTHLPYNSWADDVERQDWYSDSVADVVRPTNKVLNVWYSQLVENRTLRSYGMNYYDATVEGFTPPNIDPEPWGWVGVPGKPQDVFQKIDIPDLSESLDEMEFLLGVNDRATGATATQQGVPTQRQITLGEVKLALSEAKERSKGMSKFYTQAWKKRGEKFLKLIEAAPDKLDAVKIYKKGRNTSDIYAREIAPKDWMTKSGYRVRVWSQDEKNAQDTAQLEKLSIVRAMIPGNSKLEEVIARKALEYADLTPDEITDILRLEEEKRQALANMPIDPTTGQPMQPGMGGAPAGNGAPPGAPRLAPPAPVTV